MEFILYLSQVNIGSSSPLKNPSSDGVLLELRCTFHKGAIWSFKSWRSYTSWAPFLGKSFSKLLDLGSILRFYLCVLSSLLLGILVSRQRGNTTWVLVQLGCVVDDGTRCPLMVLIGAS